MWERVVFDFFFLITSFLNLFFFWGEGRIVCPTTHPSSPTYPLQPRTLKVASSIQLEPSAPKTHNLPVAGEQERDRQMAGHVQKKSKQHKWFCSLPTSRGGGLWHLSPRSPTPSHPYLLAPIWNLGWCEPAAEKHHGAAGECGQHPAVDGGSGGRGETWPGSWGPNQPLFSFPVFFLNPRRAVPLFSPYICWGGEGCPEWGGRFFSFI